MAYIGRKPCVLRWRLLPLEIKQNPAPLAQGFVFYTPHTIAGGLF
ncbi:hypothetical protein [Paenibacillus polymyxa]